jgi:hypothetical protein
MFKLNYILLGLGLIITVAAIVGSWRGLVGSMSWWAGMVPGDWGCLNLVRLSEWVLVGVQVQVVELGSLGFTL